MASVLLLTSACQHSRLQPYPLGVYSVPKANLPDAKAAGFNLVTGPAEKDFLDQAHRLGLKVLASPGTSAGPHFQADRARLTVQRYDAHPALWAWYLVDEPDLNGVAPDAVRQAQRFVRNAGAHRPTALVLYQGGEAENYASIADITMVDRYPIPWLPLANFPQHLRLARLALGKKKPLIAVIQAFDWTNYPSVRPVDDNLRPPTYQEMRCMTYCALAREANGIFYYCFNDGAWNIMQHAEVWDALRRVVMEVNLRLPLFEAEHVWWPYIHEFENPASGFNAALESSITPVLLRVRNGNAIVAKGDYLLTVNNTDKKLTYRITVPRAAHRTVPVFREDRTVAVRKAWLEDEFGPFDVHIYGPIR